MVVLDLSYLFVVGTEADMEEQHLSNIKWSTKTSAV